MNNDTLVKLMTELLFIGESNLYCFHNDTLYLNCSAYWDSTGISGITFIVKLANYEYGELFYSYNRFTGEKLRTIKQEFDITSDEKTVNQLIDNIETYLQEYSQL